MYDDTGPEPPTLKARAITKNRAAWLMTTNPKVQDPRRATVRTAGSLRSHRQRRRPILALTRLGIRSRNCTATPAVVPAPRRASCPGLMDTECSVGVGTTAAKTSRTPMHTTLLAMGTHMGAPKRRRTLSSAPPMLSRP